jgi:uncharacterized HAD superfamily protein
MVKKPKTTAYVTERIQHDIRCNRCNSIVLKSDNIQYKYQCMFCDEDLFDIETHKGFGMTDKEYNDILEQTDAIMCLDED